MYSVGHGRLLDRKMGMFAAQNKSIIFWDGPPEITVAIKKPIRDHSKENPPWLVNKYTIRIFQPEQGIEHKIVPFQPDPNIDFKITVFNPFGPIPEGLPEKSKPLLQQKKPHRLDQSEQQK